MYLHSFGCVDNGTHPFANRIEAVPYDVQTRL